MTQLNKKFIKKKIEDTISNFSGKAFEDKLETKKCTIIYWIKKSRELGFNLDEYLTKANNTIKEMYGEEKCIKI